MREDPLLLDETILSLQFRQGDTSAAINDTLASLGAASAKDIAAASADSAPAQSGAYVQADVQAILNELRDLKAKLRNAGILAR